MRKIILHDKDFKVVFKDIELSQLLIESVFKKYEIDASLEDLKFRDTEIVTRTNEITQRLDILLENDDVLVDLEPCVEYSEEAIRKSVTYLNTLFNRTYKKNSTYERVKDHILIVFTKENKMETKENLIMDKERISLLDDYKIIIINVAKEKEIEYTKSRTNLSIWSEFLIEEDKTKYYEIIGKFSYSEKVKEKIRRGVRRLEQPLGEDLNELDAAYERRRLYAEFRKGEKQGERKGKKAGRIQGEKAGKIEGRLAGIKETSKAVALNMFNLNMSKEVIAQCLGKTEKELEELMTQN